MRQILMIDPHCEHISTLRRLFSDEGYHVEVVPTGTQALEQFSDAVYDVILLNRDLADFDGLDVCRHIRERSKVPLLMLSRRNDARDRIAGLKAGADDYLGKPVVLAELLARMWAALRRSGAANTSHPSSDFALDLATNKAVRVRDGEEVQLTSSEMQILHFLISHPGRSLSTGVLVFKGWGTLTAPDPYRLHKVMAGLREKLEVDPARPTLLVTVPGFGYRYKPSSGTSTIMPKDGLRT